MSFFGRAANLIKGGIKSIGRPSGLDAARERALEEELARVEATRRGAARAPVTPPVGGAPAPASTDAVPERGPPERDENGDVKRTL